MEKFIDRFKCMKVTLYCPAHMGAQVQAIITYLLIDLHLN